MRVFGSAIAVCLVTAGLVTATPAAAATIRTINSVIVTVDGIASDPASFQIFGDGSVRDTFRFVACDGSVRLADLVACDGSVTPVDQIDIALTGSIFPFIEGAVSVTDSGTPTVFSVVFSMLISEIAGPADWQIAGSVDLDPFRAAPGSVTPAPGEAYFTGFVGGPALPDIQSVASLGTGAITPDPLSDVLASFGPLTGSLDCAVLGTCNLIALQFTVNGLGEGQKITLNGRFDVDPASVPAVPLPASAVLLLAGLAGLGALRRVRRAPVPR